VNAWFDRLRDALIAELDPADPRLAAMLHLTREDATALLELAREAAHGSGARQFAPLATFLAGRLVEALDVDGTRRADLIAATLRAVRVAGPAGSETL
jgi:hypothetical protein